MMADIWYFWDKSTQLWIVTCHDSDGNQLWDAMYYPSKWHLSQAWVAK